MRSIKLFAAAFCAAALCTACVPEQKTNVNLDPDFSAPETISPTKLSIVFGGTWKPVYCVSVGAAYTATMLACMALASMQAYSATVLLCSERSNAHMIFCSFGILPPMFLCPRRNAA